MHYKGRDCQTFLLKKIRDKAGENSPGGIQEQEKKREEHEYPDREVSRILGETGMESGEKSTKTIGKIRYKLDEYVDL